MAASDARGFAGRLAASDDDALARLFDVRGVSPTASWADFFDAAEALLEPPALLRGLAALTRAEADAVAAALATGTAIPAGVARDAVVAYGLADLDGVPFRAVADAWPEAAGPTADETGSAPVGTGTDADDGAEPGAPESDAHAAERAFAASAALADILHLALAAPLTRVGSGALGAADRRRVVATGAAEDGAEADELLSIAAVAGLIAPVERQWQVTAAGREWMHEGSVRRWHAVARRLRDALPAGVRDDAGGWIPLAEWPAAYPFDPAWAERTDRLRALLHRWAMVAGDAPPAWAEELARGADADEEALQALVPSEVDRLYLQNDLTAIAPGPLAPHLDMRLRAMATRESRAQASTYRFTAETIDAALTAGETASSLRDFLGALSLTGLPQPLAYEIDRASARHGSLRVGPDWSGRTRISGDDALLRTAAVDQSLRPLGLLPDEDGSLLTRTAPETAFWVLSDARYPVVAVDADGIPRVLDRHRIAATPAAPSDPADVYAPLIARLRTAHEHDAEAAWLGRELEQAVRAHAVVTVVVRLRDGSERELVLEATGFGGGRLRGKDHSADVERTLPVSSIVSVRIG